MHSFTHVNNRQVSEFRMSDTAIKTALATLDSLEARLQKVHWYLSGSEEVEDTLKQVAAQGRDDTVQARLARLENNLGKLSSRSPVVRDLLKLRSCPSFNKTSQLIRNNEKMLRILISSTRQPPTSPRPCLHRKY